LTRRRWDYVKAVRITCASCGHLLDVRDEDAGHQFFCPRCGRPLPVAHPAEPAHEPPPIPPSAEPIGRRVSGLAIVSLVMGLMSLFTCGIPLSLVAIVCGALALGQFGQEDRELGGRGLAIAGMTLGLLSLVLKPLGCIFRPIFHLF
jgi:hypothetical protein